MLTYGIENKPALRRALSGKRLGLVTSYSGRDSALTPTVDILHNAFPLTALYAPEHGIRGNIQAGAPVHATTDPATGLPVFSLYGAQGRHLTAQMLEQVDAIVYDIQDIGCRYYTYISTLHNLLKDCHQFGKELIVLDRPNPLGGRIEGNVLTAPLKSFVGTHPLPMRYGLTIGELAGLLRAEDQLPTALTVVPMEGWHRAQLFPELDKVFVAPSPGIPTFETALCYPGFCLFEGTNLSEGRGTTRPFLTIGAPFINGAALAKAVSKHRLPGVLFAPSFFTPTFSKHQNTPCEGIALYITDYSAFLPVLSALTVLAEVFRGYETAALLPPEHPGGRRFFELLFGARVEDLSLFLDPESLYHRFCNESSDFLEHAKAFYLYQ